MSTTQSKATAFDRGFFMLKFRGRTFNEVRKDIKALPMRELRDLYRTYRSLRAKGVQDTVFEQMLENELDHRI